MNPKGNFKIQNQNAVQKYEEAKCIANLTILFFSFFFLFFFQWHYVSVAWGKKRKTKQTVCMKPVSFRTVVVCGSKKKKKRKERKKDKTRKTKQEENRLREVVFFFFPKQNVCLYGRW